MDQATLLHPGKDKKGSIRRAAKKWLEQTQNKEVTPSFPAAVGNSRKKEERRGSG